MPAKTCQYEWRIIEQVFRIDVHAVRDHLLADFEIVSTACLAEPAKPFTAIERIVFLKGAILYQSLLFM